MATQRLTIATVAGKAAAVVEDLFRSLRAHSDPWTLDSFCENLRAHSEELTVVYYSEWIDRWLMGDEVPGPGAVQGRKYQATVLTPNEAIAWADKIYNQFDEQKCLKARLREAANAKEKLVKDEVIVVIREVWDVFARDEQYLAAFQIVPTWLYFGQ